MNVLLVHGLLVVGLIVAGIAASMLLPKRHVPRVGDAIYWVVALIAVVAVVDAIRHTDSTARVGLAVVWAMQTMENTTKRMNQRRKRELERAIARLKARRDSFTNLYGPLR